MINKSKNLTFSYIEKVLKIDFFFFHVNYLDIPLYTSIVLNVNTKYQIENRFVYDRVEEYCETIAN